MWRFHAVTADARTDRNMLVACTQRVVLQCTCDRSNNTCFLKETPKAQYRWTGTGERLQASKPARQRERERESSLEPPPALL